MFTRTCLFPCTACSMGETPGLFSRAFLQCSCRPKIFVLYTSSFTFSVCILPSPSLASSESSHTHFGQRTSVCTRVHAHTHPEGPARAQRQQGCPAPLPRPRLSLMAACTLLLSQWLMNSFTIAAFSPSLTVTALYFAMLQVFKQLTKG